MIASTIDRGIRVAVSRREGQDDGPILRSSSAMLPLRSKPDPDGEGELFATLVRRADDRPARHTVLAVHGFTDYFFNTELVEHFPGRGIRFYGIDLHKCGRSWRDGQTPHFTTDLALRDPQHGRWFCRHSTPTSRSQLCDRDGMCQRIARHW